MTPANLSDQLGPANEAHPLVRRLDDMAAGWLCAGLPDAELPAEAAREIERLSAEVAELDALRDKLAGLLSRTAVALRGPEPPLTRWSWHDVPDRAAAAIALVHAAERARLTPLTYDAAHAVFESQTWEQAVRECVTDPAEAERLLALADDATTEEVHAAVRGA